MKSEIQALVELLESNDFRVIKVEAEINNEFSVRFESETILLRVVRIVPRTETEKVAT
jgi:hypothetical protein